MLTKLNQEKRQDIESLCTHIENHLYHLREALSAEKVSKVHEQAEEIKGWGEAIQSVCKGGD